MSISSAPWYPGADDNLQHFVYTSSLSQQNSELFNTASSMLKQAHSNIGVQNFINNTYKGLENLWKKERTAEKAFIKKYFKIDIDYNKDEVKEILKVINSIMQDKAVLEDSLKRIHELELEKDKKYKGKFNALYILTNSILPNAINEAIESFLQDVDIEYISDDKIIEKFANKIIRTLKEKIEVSLINDYNNEEQKVYISLLESLEKMQSKDELIEKILEAYGFSLKKVVSLFQNASKTKNIDNLEKSLKVSKDTKIAGNVNEIIIGDFLKKIALGIKEKDGSIHIDVTDTGDLRFMKADHIIYMGKVNINTELLKEIFLKTARKTSEITPSVRRQNIAGIQAMLDNVKEAEESIVEISDKNYKLTGDDFAKNNKTYSGGGFKAERSNLITLSQVLDRTSINSSRLDDLIFILANSGRGFINNSDYQDAIRIIALNIGSFLFDDVFITDALDDYRSNLNVIHLFNLNGIYVPLSIFLEGAAIAFNKNNIDFKRYVKIEFNVETELKKPNYEQNNLTKDDWINYYNEKLKKSNLTYHFFGDFIEFIKQNMPI